jgi:hypothetical protein
MRKKERERLKTIVMCGLYTCSGSMRRASLSNVDIGPTCQGFLYVKS